MAMNPQWHDFLSTHGASMVDGMVDGRVQHFGSPAAELAVTAAGSAILTDLSHLGLLELTGEDTATFLQGQVTNDVRLLDGSNSQYAGYCTAKGRLLATLLLWQQGDAIFAQMDGSVAAAVMKRLGMFVLRAKVRIADAGENRMRFGIAGEGGTKALAEMFPALPQLPHQIATHGDTALLCLPGTAPRFEIVTPADAAPALWQQLSRHCKPVGAPCWEWLEIRAGIASVTAATQEEFVPQMLNLDLLGGINFKKGCYTGQEIVARTHYLGKVKRRTQLAHIASEQTPQAQAPQAGDDVFGSGTAEPVGKIVNAAAAPAGGFDVLAEIRLESLEAGPLRWKAQDGPVLELLALPYGF
jgi:folate-binding protein YgfZ